MLKKIVLQILATIMILFLMNTDSFAQTRIQFKRGRNSAIVSGTLGAGVKRVFVVRGKAGQELSIDVKTSSKNVIVYPEGEEDGEWGKGTSYSLETSGDHFFVVSNSGKATRYTMTVTIR